jgi:hypothetical protein
VNHGLRKRYRIGLANLCTTKSDRVVVETIRIAREFCEEYSFHIFGAKLTAVAKAIEMHYLRHGDSFDTFSWHSQEEVYMLIEELSKGIQLKL